MNKLKVNKQLLIKFIVIIVIIILCFAYLRLRATYTSYESNVTGKTNATIADWNITINDKSLTTATTKVVTLDDITWTNAHAKSTKVAPGSTGTLTLVINPHTTGVAIKYDLKVVDKTVDATKALTMTSMSVSGNALTRTAVDTYTGLFSLADISSGTTQTITINLSWLNDDAVNDYYDPNSTTTEDDALLITFTAYQYKGETITPYQG
jgi:hypothetical protein